MVSLGFQISIYKIKGHKNVKYVRIWSWTRTQSQMTLTTYVTYKIDQAKQLLNICLTQQPMKLGATKLSPELDLIPTSCRYVFGGQTVKGQGHVII